MVEPMLLIILIVIGVIVFVLIAISLWRMLRGDEELEPAGTWGDAIGGDDESAPTSSADRSSD